MDLDHIGDHLPARQTVIDTVRPLALPIADIGTIVTCSITAGLLDTLPHFFYQKIQVSASRMTVTVSALDHHLYLRKVFRLPSRSDPQRIQFRRQLTHFLTL